MLSIIYQSFYIKDIILIFSGKMEFYFQQNKIVSLKIVNMSIDVLTKDIFLLIINNFENEPVYLTKCGDKTLLLPSRRNILNLYCVCKNFSWLENLSISSALRYKEEALGNNWYSTFNTFDIFGSEIGIQIISDCAMYCVDGITGFYFEDNIKFRLEYPFTSYVDNECTDYYRVNCIKGFVEKNDAIFTLTEMGKQINELDPDFYQWLIKSLNGYNKLLLRHKNKQNYNFKFMEKINLDVCED
jgi:hypothetical protein